MFDLPSRGLNLLPRKKRGGPLEPASGVNGGSPQCPPKAGVTHPLRLYGRKLGAMTGRLSISIVKIGMYSP